MLLTTMLNTPTNAVSIRAMAEPSRAQLDAAGADREN